MDKKKTSKSPQFKYRVDIFWSEEDQAYVVRVPELPGCVTDGETFEEAAKNAGEVIELYLESLKSRGLAIPTPMAERKFSGKIPLRIEPTLHRDLMIKAEIEGESLNKFIEKNLKKAI